MAKSKHQQQHNSGLVFHMFPTFHHIFQIFIHIFVSFLYPNRPNIFFKPPSGFGSPTSTNSRGSRLSTIDARPVQEQTRFPLLGATAGLAGHLGPPAFDRGGRSQGVVPQEKWGCHGNSGWFMIAKLVETSFYISNFTLAFVVVHFKGMISQT